MTDASIEKTETSPIFNRALAGLMADFSAQQGPQSSEPLLVGPVFGPGCLRDGVAAADTVDQIEWEGLYVRLRAEAADLLPELPELRELRRRAAAAAEPGVTPIALFDIRYRSPGRRLTVAMLKASRDDTDIAMPAGLLDELFDTRTAFAASALLAPEYWGFDRQPDQHRGSLVRFKLASDLWVSNGPRPERIEADFGDGQGFRALGWDEVVEVDYMGDNEPRVTLRAALEGAERSATFQLRIAEPRRGAPGAPAPAGDDRNEPIEAKISHGGTHYKGRCHVYYSWTNRTGRLRNPILLAEGFPGAAHNDAIYDIFNGETPSGRNDQAWLADDLRRRGYDVVILIFAKAGAPIQGNAFVYLAALQWMWGDMGGKNKITAAGGSMGGLIARYALTYAEFGPPEHRIDLHYVDKMITFDSPHTGANVPVAVQFTARFFGKKHAPDGNEMLDYPSAEQMLIHQVRLAEGNGPFTKPEFTNFYAELEGMGPLGGYPTRPLKYAVSNGALDGHPLASPEVRALHMWRTHGTDRNYRVYLYMSPNRVIGADRKLYADCYFSNFGYRISAYAGPNDTPTPFYSRDGGAGGFTGHFKKTHDQLKPTCAYPGIEMDHENNCFVPVFSALGVKFSGDAYTGFKPTQLKPNDTPFHAWYASRNNQWHCTIDRGIREWVLQMFPEIKADADAEALEVAV